MRREMTPREVAEDVRTPAEKQWDRFEDRELMKSGALFAKVVTAILGAAVIVAAVGILAITAIAAVKCVLWMASQ